MRRYEGDVAEYTSRRRTATRLVVEQPDLIRESLSKVPGDATGGADIGRQPDPGPGLGAAPT